MTAIFGVWNKDGAPACREASGCMRDALEPWARQSSGEWLDGPLALGALHSRSSAPWQRDPQPATYAGLPHLVVVADAWLDNRAELADVLGVPAERRQGVSDSELIVRAYARWEEACPGRLLGDFAFALWDGLRRILFCARDHAGCRPFVYRDSPDRFVFASDIRAVLAYPGTQDQLDEAMIAASLCQGTHFAEKRRTYFQGILKLPPAHGLVVKGPATSSRAYWSPADAPPVRLASDDDYAEQARELLRQAVDARVTSDVPMGAHLSSGLDSSAVAVLAARRLRESGQGLVGFSWSPSLEARADGGPADERRIVERIARDEGITVSYLELGLDQIVEAMLIDFTVEPAEMLEREATVQREAQARGVGVILSGWGGDEGISYNGRGCLAELLAGGRWVALAGILAARARRTEGLLRRAKLLAGQVRLHCLRPWVAPWVERASTLRHRFVRPPGSCIHPDLFRRERRRAFALRSPSLETRPDARAIRTALWENGHLVRRVESWAVAGARHGVTYRYPLLDRRVVEFALGLPCGQFVAGGLTRTVARRALRGILPDDVCGTRDKADAVEQERLHRLGEQAWGEAFRRVRARAPIAATSWVDDVRLGERAEGYHQGRTYGPLYRAALVCYGLKVLALPVAGQRDRDMEGA